MWCIVGASPCKSNIGHGWGVERSYLRLAIGAREAQWENNLEHWLTVPECSIWLAIVAIELEAFWISGSKGMITERENVLGSWKEAYLATVDSVVTVVIITVRGAGTAITIVHYHHHHRDHLKVLVS
jgi:hypothetical protein